MNSEGSQVDWTDLRYRLRGDMVLYFSGVQLVVVVFWFPIDDPTPLLLPYLVPGLVSLFMAIITLVASSATRYGEAGLERLWMVERMTTRCRYVWFPVAGAALIADLVADPDMPLSTAVTVLAVFCAWPTRRLTKYLRSHAQPEPGA